MARRILLADDSVTAQNMGRRILTDAGYELVTVNNGSAALKKIAELKPDIVVLDVYMPGYGGLEVCQRIKENPETARIPVLLTVGKLEPFKPDEARRVKADAFIVKPFEATELLTALTKLEDKIVAAPQPQKSGRFAKALAAVEQSDTGERFGNKETGWKNRLTIPAPDAKPKQAEEIPEVVAEPPRDFDRPEGSKLEVPSREFERPIPAGLPADITPEEIAAITAAAASFDGKAAHPVVIAEGSASDSAVAMQAASAEAAPVQTNEPEAPAATLASAPQTEAGPAPPAEVVAEATSAAPPEISTEDAAEVATEAASPAPVEVVAEAAPVEAQVVSELAANSDAPKVEDTPSAIEPPVAAAETEPGPQAVAEAPIPESQASRNDDDVMAAIASLAPSNGHSNGVAHDVHLAVSSLGTEGITGPRWIAESVAVTAEESTLVLEQEMERASAATAVGEAVSNDVVGNDQAAASVAEVPAPVAETVGPDVESTVEAGASVAESVSADSVAVDAVAAETVPSAASSESAIVEAISQNVETVSIKEESAYAAAAAAGSGTEHATTVDVISSTTISAEVQESVPVATVEVMPQEAAPEREAELAAAWQNWKQIRESIVSAQPPASVAPFPAAEQRTVEESFTETEEEENETDEVEAASGEGPGESTAIASIVDSMLAELRPKLVEEIAKKMNSEKKQKAKEKEKKKKR